MVTIPILRQKNALKKHFAQFTLGMAILEDIFAVVLLTIFSNATQETFQWKSCLNLIFWMTAFIASMLVFGRLLAQKFLRILHNIHNEEVIHVCVVGLILLLSELFHGYSNALGAFLSGAIFSSTYATGKLESMVAPIRDLFTAIFFVSIGMMIEPKLLWAQKTSILLFSLAVFWGYFFSVWLSFFLSGQSGKTSFRATLPNSQIGEFSFVLAALAQKLGVSDGRLMAITVGTSLMTIIAVNVVSLKDEAFFNLCVKCVPASLKSWGALYQNILVSIQSRLSKNVLLALIRRPLLKISILFFFINVLVWCNAWLCNFIERYEWPYLLWVQGSLSAVTLLLALPFIGNIVRNLNMIIFNVCKHTLRDFFQRISKHPSIYQIFQLVISTLATLCFAWLFLISCGQFLPKYLPVLVLALLILVFGFIFWTRFKAINSQIESMFLESFRNELESSQERDRRAMMEKIAKKQPWDVEVRTVVIQNNSNVIGRHLIHTHLREKTGVTLIGICRGNYMCYEINANMVFFPNDNVVLLGTKAQLQAAEALLNHPNAHGALPNHEIAFDIESILITAEHPWANETLANLDIGKRFCVNIIGVQRNEKKIENFKPSDLFKIGDVVWLVGTPHRIQALKV